MRILYFTKYSRLGASSRLRSYQYIPYLKESGYHVAISPLFDDEYVKSLFTGDSAYSSMIKGYLKRFFALFTLFKYDSVVIEYELFPYFPAFFEYIISKMGVKYAVDYDDAIFHNYDLNPNKMIRLLLSNKIAKVMKYSSVVLAGNAYLASYAERSGAKKVELLPTVINADRYHQKVIRPIDRVVIGWIGSPSTFKYLKTLLPVFQKLSLKKSIEVQIVGAGDTMGLPEIERQVQWTEATEVGSILNFDIGVMPLDDSPWAKGKCSYKLIQYLASGIPVIASPVGMNVEIVKQGVNGFLADSTEEWEKAFLTLIDSVELRNQLGREGYKLISENYTLQVQAPRLVHFLRNM